MILFYSTGYYWINSNTSLSLIQFAWHNGTHSTNGTISDIQFLGACDWLKFEQRSVAERKWWRNIGLSWFLTEYGFIAICVHNSKPLLFYPSYGIQLTFKHWNMYFKSVINSWWQNDTFLRLGFIPMQQMCLTFTATCWRLLVCSVRQDIGTNPMMLFQFKKSKLY